MAEVPLLMGLNVIGSAMDMAARVDVIVVAIHDRRLQRPVRRMVHAVTGMVVPRVDDNRSTGWRHEL